MKNININHHRQGRADYTFFESLQNEDYRKMSFENYSSTMQDSGGGVSYDFMTNN